MEVPVLLEVEVDGHSDILVMDGHYDVSLLILSTLSEYQVGFADHQFGVNAFALQQQYRIFTVTLVINNG